MAMIERWMQGLSVPGTDGQKKRNSIDPEGKAQPRSDSSFKLQSIANQKVKVVVRNGSERKLGYLREERGEEGRNNKFFERESNRNKKVVRGS